MLRFVSIYFFFTRARNIVLACTDREDFVIKCRVCFTEVPLCAVFASVTV